MTNITHKLRAAARDADAAVNPTGDAGPQSERLAALLFGPRALDAGLAIAVGPAGRASLAEQLVSHPLNSDAAVARHRLDCRLSEDDRALLVVLLGVPAETVQIGHSLHGALRRWAESCLPKTEAEKLVHAMEGALPLEGCDGLWQRMADEGGVVAAATTWRHGPSERDLALRLEFSRGATGNLIDELAQFIIHPGGVTVRLPTGFSVVYAPRLFALYPIILPFFERCELIGSFDVSLGDEGLMDRVLAFCSIVPDYLVPDPYFIRTGGYHLERTTYGEGPAWDERIDQAYWRGTDTGVFRYYKWEEAPRVAVCLQSIARPDLIDARITKLEPRPNWKAKEEFYERHGLLGPEEDQTRILQYRYQIDVDGNTNTWSGLFLKLLTGMPVLKVESEFSFRQWFYDRLVPWVNYVPVRFDAADLVERIEWLRANPDDARRIGAAGRRLALGVTHDDSIAEAQARLARLVMLNRRWLRE